MKRFPLYDGRTRRRQRSSAVRIRHRVPEAGGARPAGSRGPSIVTRNLPKRSRPRQGCGIGPVHQRAAAAEGFCRVSGAIGVGARPRLPDGHHSLCYRRSAWSAGRAEVGSGAGLALGCAHNGGSGGRRTPGRARMGEGKGMPLVMLDHRERR